MVITEDQLRAILPDCKDPEGWAEALTKALPEKWDASVVARFIAQCAHESASFNTVVENLNYSAERLKVVFPKYFKTVDANLYHRNPEKIANRVYADRMGNGSEESGEGWKYRGRGIIQLTGKTNYFLFSKYHFGDPEVLVNDPDKLLEKELAIASAVWFWENNGLSHVDDFTRLTKLINGGLNGLEHRQALLQAAESNLS